MFKSRYSTILTVLLIILIVAIVILVIVLGVKTIKDYRDDKNTKEFVQSLPTSDKDSSDDDEPKTEEEVIAKIEAIEKTDNSTSENSSASLNVPNVKFHNGYPTIGVISIPKTNVSYPIYLDTSAQALEKAVGVTYPSSPKLNQPGNVVIIGHNYRNGKLFSNNKNLVTGDIIRVTDLDGKTLSYTIYEIFTTTPTDTAYMTRNTDGQIEISLSTCTDDGNNRLVILARAKQ